jgi:hypothetical protein
MAMARESVPLENGMIPSVCEAFLPPSYREAHGIAAVAEIRAMSCGAPA